MVDGLTKAEGQFLIKQILANKDRGNFQSLIMQIPARKGRGAALKAKSSTDVMRGN